MRPARPTPTVLAARFARASLVALVVAVAASPAGAEEVPSIGVTALETRLAQPDAPLVLDVRTREEFDAGHIPGAVHVPHTEVAKRLDLFSAAREIAIYCRVGPRARAAEQALRAAGLTRLLHVEGGFTAWQKAGLPVALP